MNDITLSIKAYLKSEFEMDDEDIQEMLEVFAESMRELRDAAKKQLQNSDTTGLGETGHAIKGAAANVGAASISEIGKRLETAGKNGDTDECALAVSEFEQSLVELV